MDYSLLRPLRDAVLARGRGSLGGVIDGYYENDDDDGYCGGGSFLGTTEAGGRSGRRLM